MKISTKIFFTLILSLQLNIFAQIPNSGFENWTDGNPDDWFTDNVPGAYTPVTQSTESHTGSFALRLGVSNYFTAIIPGYIWSGDNFAEGFPISQAYTNLSGYYQLNSAGNDELYIVVYMLKEGNVIAANYMETNTNTTGGYNQFNIPIEYGFSNEVPDGAFIWCLITDSSDGQFSEGTYALLDDLEFSGSVDVDEEVSTELNTFALKQNFPNPFNPSTKINFSIAEESFVELIVFDILGNEIRKLISDYYPAGEVEVNFEADDLPGGVYIAELTTGKYSKAIKMTLLK
jgi:hypothetical protein